MTAKRKPVVLPEKASDLLELAVRDAMAVAKMKGYKLDMGTWHSPNGVCRVCMAGAVMARTLRVARGAFWSPGIVGHHWSAAMWDINNFREGYWPDRRDDGGKAWPAMQLIQRDFLEYRDGGRAKWSTYLKAAKMLRAVGL